MKWQFIAYKENLCKYKKKAYGRKTVDINNKRENLTKTDRNCLSFLRKSKKFEKRLIIGKKEWRKVDKYKKKKVKNGLIEKSRKKKKQYKIVEKGKENKWKTFNKKMQLNVWNHGQKKTKTQREIDLRKPKTVNSEEASNKCKSSWCRYRQRPSK